MRASTCPLLMILFVVLSCAHEAVMAQSPDTNKATTSLEKPCVARLPKRWWRPGYPLHPRCREGLRHGGSTLWSGGD
jgi:hypothetical protein